jgi:hypothetical protein
MLGASAEQEFIEGTMPDFRAKRRVHHSADLGLSVGDILDAAISRFVQAFERRADAIYGRRQRPSCLPPQVLKSSDVRITDADPSPRQLYPVKVGASPFATDRIDAALDLNQ